MKATAATHDNASICTIDCDKIAKPFYLVMIANYVLLSKVTVVPDMVFEGVRVYGLSPKILVLLFQFFAISFAAWMAWRNITVLHAVNQRMTVVSLLLASAALFLSEGIYSGITFGKPGEWSVSGDLRSWSPELLIFAAISVMLLRSRKVNALDIRLVDLMRTMEPSVPITALHGVPPRNRRRGRILLGMAFGIDFIFDLVPHVFWHALENYAHYSIIGFFLSVLIILLGFLFSLVLLLAARMQFQPTGELTLKEDSRPPVLFLRSFKDDQTLLKSLFSTGYLLDSILDPSLETRLASHFSNSGPFVAVGKRGRVFTFGAARLSINDDSEWQDRVVELMDSARLIVLIAGTTRWLQWELRTLVDRGHFDKLILLFPEQRESSRMSTARLEAIINAFIGTSWESSLRAITPPKRVRGLVFQKDGLVTVVQAKSRSRNSYHLAAIIAHYLLTDERLRTSQDGTSRGGFFSFRANQGGV